MSANSHTEEIILKLRDLFSGKLKGAQQATEKLRGTTDRLGGSYNRLAKQARNAAIAVGAVAAVKSIARLGIQMEQTRVSFETFLGSAQLANETIQELNQFANVTPFRNDQVLDASKRLMAYGVQAKELIPTLEILGDTAAGVGMDKMNSLILAFGQVKAATKLTGMELRQFTEAGVPLLEELAKMMKVPVSVIKDELIPAGKVGFPLVQQALANLTGEGGRFADLMEKQSKTLGGRISTLQGQIQTAGIAMGEALLPFLKQITERVAVFTEWLVKNKKAIASYVPIIAKTITAIGGLIVVLKVWQGVQAVINFLLTANPIGVVIMAIAALAAGIVWLVRKMNDGTQAGKALYNIFQLMIFPIRMQIRLWKYLYNVVADWVAQSEVAQFIIRRLKQDFELLKKVGGFLIDFFAELPSHTQAAFETIKNQVKSMVDILAAPLKMLANPFDKEARKKAIAQLQSGIENLRNSGKIYRDTFLASQQRAEERRKNIAKQDPDEAAPGLTSFGGVATASTSGKKLSGSLAGVSSNAPKNVTITIERLIEEFNINSSSVKESAQEMAELVRNTLLTAVNDAQIQGGQ